MNRALGGVDCEVGMPKPQFEENTEESLAAMTLGV